MWLLSACLVQSVYFSGLQEWKMALLRTECLYLPSRPNSYAEILTPNVALLEDVGPLEGN